MNSTLLPAEPLREVLLALVLGIYTLTVVYGTKLVYDYMIGRGVPVNVAVYYNRKIIHMLAGGIIALVTPILFTSPLIPSLAALALGGFLYYHHRSHKLLYWFQTEENMYEVNFTIAWGISLLILWIALEDPRLAVLPGLFIAFGDAVTGIVRNYLFARRIKHWSGNIAMALVVIPMGYYLGGLIGAIAGLVASIIERFEFGIIDDNLLIALSSTIILFFSLLS